MAQIPGLTKVAAWFFRRVVKRSEIQNQREKLYKELVQMYTCISVAVKHVEDNAGDIDVERIMFGKYTLCANAEYFRYLRPNVEAWTDLPGHTILDGLFNSFLGIPTGGDDDRTLRARLAVVHFEDAYLRGKIDRNLVKSLGSKGIRTSLEVIERGDRDSILDLSHDQ